MAHIFFRFICLLHSLPVGKDIVLDDEIEWTRCSELESLGNGTQPLAAHLNGLAQNVDMSGIKAVLEEIRTVS